MHRKPLRKRNVIQTQTRTRCQKRQVLKRRTARESTDSAPAVPTARYREKIPLLVAQSSPAYHNTCIYTQIISARKQNSTFCVQAQLRDAAIPPGVRADDRGGQGELHGAGVDDFHDVAGFGRRDNAEERPVQPILSVQLDDLRRPVCETRHAGMTRRACVACVQYTF